MQGSTTWIGPFHFWGRCAVSVEGGCTGYLDHPFAYRISLRARSVYLYFKQSTAAKEEREQKKL